MKTLVFSLVLLALFASGLASGDCDPPCGDYEYCDYNTNDCVCDYGFTGSPGNCIDIDECQDNSTCAYVEGSECNNTIGSYECVCDPGYIRCGSSCILEGMCPVCGNNSYCSCYTGYECRCNYGYTGTGINGTCEDINECEDSNRCDYLRGSTCVNYDGGYECVCEPGYTPCYASNECILDLNQECPECYNGYCSCSTNFECVCNYGFTGNGGFCEDVDECADECNSLCDYPRGSICNNTIGGYECVCPPGYTECNGYKCILNETCPDCEENEVCNCNTGFECDCDYGFRRNDEGYCVDIDECEDNYTCSYMEGTVCYNTPGSYDCLCADGYMRCYDNYQCTLNGTCPECDSDSYCGCSTDFECRCNYGYTGESGSCEDIDECEDNYTCAYREGTVCNNTIGSYECVCEEGYIQCDYSYECTPNGTCPACGDNEYCSCRTDFECRCNYGFTGVSGYCEDINECELDDPCEYERTGRVCVNTPGYYECRCPPGYYFCYTLYQCMSIYEPIRLKPTVVEDRYECYPYDTMDERRDIRCLVRSVIEEKIRLALMDPPDGGSGVGPSDGPGGSGDGPEGPTGMAGEGP